jgi:homoserine kinase
MKNIITTIAKTNLKNLEVIDYDINNEAHFDNLNKKTTNWDWD